MALNSTLSPQMLHGCVDELNQQRKHERSGCVGCMYDYNACWIENNRNGLGWRMLSSYANTCYLILALCTWVCVCVCVCVCVGVGEKGYLVDAPIYSWMPCKEIFIDILSLFFSVLCVFCIDRPSCAYPSVSQNTCVYVLACRCMIIVRFVPGRNYRWICVSFLVL